MERIRLPQHSVRPRFGGLVLLAAAFALSGCFKSAALIAEASLEVIITGTVPSDQVALSLDGERTILDVGSLEENVLEFHATLAPGRHRADVEVARVEGKVCGQLDFSTNAANSTTISFDVRILERCGESVTDLDGGHVDGGEDEKEPEPEHESEDDAGLPPESEADGQVDGGPTPWTDAGDETPENEDRDGGTLPPPAILDAGGQSDGGAATNEMTDGGANDAGNSNMADAGTPSTSRCGNGKIEMSEACDDGNLNDEDGCNEFCQFDFGYRCIGEPSFCALASDVVIVGPGDILQTLIDDNSAGIFFLTDGIHQGGVELNDAPGIVLAGSSNAIVRGGDNDTLRLRNVTSPSLIFGITLENFDLGKDAASLDNSEATFINTTLGPSSGYGLRANSSSDVEVIRTLVHDNLAGGLRLDCNMFIETSVIVNNGGVNSDSGIHFESSATGTVLFSTIANNRANSGTEGGVHCGAVSIEGSLIWGNQAGGNAVSTDCSIISSNVDQGIGAGNTQLPPVFVDANALDYHLRRNAPCRDTVSAGMLSEIPEVDVDFQPRLGGLKYDPGADEVY